MGGLRKAIPFTWAMMLIGNLALTGVGIPVLRHRARRLLFQGRASSTRPSRRAHRHRHLCLHADRPSALMTSFYSWRQFLMTFHGRYRGADDTAIGPWATHTRTTSALIITTRRRARTVGSRMNRRCRCWCRWACWRSARCSPAALFDDCFIGGKSGGFLAWRLACDSPATARAEGEIVPVWVELAPFIAHHHRLR